MVSPALRVISPYSSFYPTNLLRGGPVRSCLNGQIDIDLDGKIETVKGRLRTSFKTVPDAPITKFSLSLNGGHTGLLVNSTNLCKAPLATVVQVGGQSGAADNQNQKLQAPCGGAKHKRHLRRARKVR